MISSSQYSSWVSFLKKKWGSISSSLSYDSLKLIISHCTSRDPQSIRLASDLLKYIMKGLSEVKTQNLLTTYLYSEATFKELLSVTETNCQSSFLSTLSDTDLRNHTTSINNLSWIINTLLTKNKIFIKHVITTSFLSSLFSCLTLLLRIYTDRRGMVEDVKSLRIMHISPCITPVGMFSLINTIQEHASMYRNYNNDDNLSDWWIKLIVYYYCVY